MRPVGVEAGPTGPSAVPRSGAVIDRRATARRGGAPSAAPAARDPSSAGIAAA